MTNLPHKKGNLIRLLDLDSDFIIELKYATPNNFTNNQIYDSNECYIDEHTALRLIKAKEIFKKDGYTVKIWDAYRPVSAQQKFWDLIHDNDFVAYPPNMKTMTEFKNSHMNGQCVDITLTLNDGTPLPMPSDFDDFSDKAKLDCAKDGSIEKKNAQYLRDTMVSCGFDPYSGEWWHFYDRKTKPVKYSDFIF